MFGFGKSKKKSAIAAAPELPGGEELYDMIMEKIEPDLISANVNKLDEQYAGETEEQRVERMERYKAAFSQYLEAYKEHQNTQTTEIRTYGKTLMQDIEDKSAEKDTDELANLESAISNA